MKEIKKYVCSRTGKEFSSEKEALLSERRADAIKEHFSFWKPLPKEADKDCDFANGRWCYQRTKQEYNQLIKAIITAVNKFEPWISEIYEKHGGIKPEYVKGHTILERYLDDGNSDIRSWYEIQANTCSTCYREYGQGYYALNCHHNGTTGKRGEGIRKIETKRLS